tara:strand:- start:216 stop:1757 length:1542 start_codon:yes stop_codon:yes gene_type:complete
MSREDSQRYYQSFSTPIPPSVRIDPLDKIKKDAKFQRDLAQKSLIDSIVNPIAQAGILKGLYGSKKGLKGLRSKLNSKISKPIVNAFKKVGNRIIGKNKTQELSDILEKHGSKFADDIANGKDPTQALTDTTSDLTNELTGKLGDEASTLVKNSLDDVRQRGDQEVNKVLDAVNSKINQGVKTVNQGIDAATSRVNQGIDDATSRVNEGVEAATSQVNQGIDAATSQVNEGVEAATSQVNEGVEAATSQVNEGVDLSRSTIESFNQDGAEQAGGIQNYMKNFMNDLFKGSKQGGTITENLLDDTTNHVLTSGDSLLSGGSQMSLNSVSSNIESLGSSFIEKMPTTSTEVPDLTKNITDTNFFEKDPLMEGDAPTTSTYSSSDLTQNITDTNFYEKDPLLDDVKNVGKDVLDTTEDDLKGLDDINIEDIPEIVASGIGETALEGAGEGVVALGEAVDAVAPEITPISIAVDLATVGLGVGLTLWRSRFAKQPTEEAPKTTTSYTSIASSFGIDD